MIITPTAGLPTGTSFTVVVGYVGAPEVSPIPTARSRAGYPQTTARLVVGEPQESPGWYPANDNPRDKATYDFTITVLTGLTVMANGVPRVADHHRRLDHLRVERDFADGAVPCHSDDRRLRPDSQHTATGLPSYAAVDPTLPKGVVLEAAGNRGVLQLHLRPVPVRVVGAIVDDAKRSDTLETQTKPVFYKVPDEETLAHEISHMWYGDS